MALATTMLEVHISPAEMFRADVDFLLWLGVVVERVSIERQKQHGS